MSAAGLYFGGSFDPLHIGHLFVAGEACDRLGTKILFVPSARNPLKKTGPQADGQARLEMLRLATAGDQRFGVHDIEVARDDGSPSYTIDTIRALVVAGELEPRPGMIIGDDLVESLPDWHRAKELLDEVRLVIVRRDDRVSPPTSLPTDTVTIANPQLQISSTELRARISTGRSIHFLVPDVVEHYIRTYELYG